jgi:ATP-binding cassette subfamily B protein
MVVAACASVSTEIVIPLLTKSVIDRAIAHDNRGLLILLGLAAIGLGVGQATLNFLRRWIQASAVTGMERAMRDDLYAHLQRLHVGFHDEWQSGQLLSRATTDLSAIRRFAGFGIVFLITNVATFVAVTILLIRLNWWLGLVNTVVVLPVTVASARFERRYRLLSRQAQDQQGDLATYVEEAAAGIRVLKALGRRREAAAQHSAGAALVFRTQVSKARLRGSFWAGLDLIPNAVIGIILFLGAVATSRHELTLGGLVAFITLTLLLVWPIEATGFILASGQEAATAAQRIYEIFDSRPAVASPARPVADPPPGAASPAPAPAVPRARPAPGPAGPVTAGPVTAGPVTGSPAPAAGRAAPALANRQPAGQLVIERVSFHYPGSDRSVLREVTLEVPRGQTVVLTGATGSGQTTLLHLVPRLADPASGVIRLDGTDIRRLPLRLLRSRVGCAFEDATLFSASVRENVTYGAPDADEAAVEQALAAAQALFVHDLPWGLDTRIGEQGMALSGGQRQRVALARAILARPSVLVLDDPLSALDVSTEDKVTRALQQVLAGTTALVVAHRPSTVMLADRVALLAGGTIAALGTHAQLLAGEPSYRELMSGVSDPQADDGSNGRHGEAVRT